MPRRSQRLSGSDQATEKPPLILPFQPFTHLCNVLQLDLDALHGWLLSPSAQVPLQAWYARALKTKRHREFVVEAIMQGRYCYDRHNSGGEYPREDKSAKTAFLADVLDEVLTARELNVADKGRAGERLEGRVKETPSTEQIWATGVRELVQGNKGSGQPFHSFMTAYPSSAATTSTSPTSPTSPSPDPIRTKSHTPPTNPPSQSTLPKAHLKSTTPQPSPSKQNQAYKASLSILALSFWSLVHDGESNSPWTPFVPGRTYAPAPADPTLLALRRRQNQRRDSRLCGIAGQDPDDTYDDEYEGSDEEEEEDEEQEYRKERTGKQAKTEDEEDKWWPATAILAESKATDEYLIDYVGYEPEWQPRWVANAALREEWEGHCGGKIRALTLEMKTAKTLRGKGKRK